MENNNYVNSDDMWMNVQSPISLSIYLSIYLLISLLIFLSLYLSLTISLIYLYLSIYLCIPISLSFYLSIHHLASRIYVSQSVHISQVCFSQESFLDGARMKEYIDRYAEQNNLSQYIR